MIYKFITILVMGLFCNISTASPKLMESCIKNHKGVSKSDCACMVKQIETNPNIIKLFKKAKRKFGEKFNQNIMKELQTNWWTGEKYKRKSIKGKNLKLNDDESMMLVISMNASFTCMASAKPAIQK